MSFQLERSHEGKTSPSDESAWGVKKNLFARTNHVRAAIIFSLDFDLVNIKLSDARNW